MTGRNVIPPPHERGAALLTVLLLVAVMAVIAAVMLERLNLATRLTANGQAAAEARLIALGSEQLVANRIGAIVRQDQDRTVDTQGQLGREQTLPLPRGRMALRIEDAGNCFNLNSVVKGEPGSYTIRVEGHTQLRSLMRLLDVPEGEAIVISDAVVDWIDSDDISMPNGAEDAYYKALSPRYRTSAELIAEPSELRAMKGMTPAIYERLRGWVCALPVNDLSPININTLRPDQARLVSMIVPETLNPDRVRALLAQRPANGFPDASIFNTAGPDGANQLASQSRWFSANMAITVGDVTVYEAMTIDVSSDRVRIVHRSWGEQL